MGVERYHLKGRYAALLAFVRGLVLRIVVSGCRDKVSLSAASPEAGVDAGVAFLSVFLLRVVEDAEGVVEEVAMELGVAAGRFGLLDLEGRQLVTAV